MNGEDCTTAGVYLPRRIEWRGEPVLTTAEAAKGLGTEPTNLGSNYDRNRDRFEEGVHYVKLTGSDLKLFRDEITQGDLVKRRASHLMLWTKRGVARHAKMLETEQAWAAFEALERAYFEPAHAPSELSPSGQSIMAVGPLTQTAACMADSMGMTGNDRTLFILKTIRQEPGGRIVEQNIHELGLLEAARPEPLLTPTDLAEELGGKPWTARTVNIALQDLGLQTRVGKKPMPTQKALDAGYCHMSYTNKKHSDGTPITQLRWFASVLSELRKEEEEAV